MNTNLVSQIRDSPNLEGQVPVFVSPPEQGGLVIPPGTGFPFVASYDSQGYAGSIRPGLHRGWSSLKCSGFTPQMALAAGTNMSLQFFPIFL
jgi:hypothetical protein